jgi:sulfur-carrier protein
VSGRELRSRDPVQIRFFATIREITGVSEIRWDEPTATLGELLHALSSRYGSTFRRWVLENDDLGKTVLVVINGHDSRHQGGIATPLHPDDTIAIFPAIAGGGGRA